MTQGRFAGYGRGSADQAHTEITLSERMRIHAEQLPNCKRSQEIVRMADAIASQWGFIS